MSSFTDMLRRQFGKGDNSKTMMRKILGWTCVKLDDFGDDVLDKFLECAVFILRLPVWLFTNINICFWAIKQLISTNIIAHFVNPDYHHASCSAWPKLSRACGAAYPKSQLKVCDTPDLLKYAMRHAMCAYPPRMLVALGELPASFLMPFKTTEEVVQHCFDLESKNLKSDIGFFDEDIESHSLNIERDFASHTVRADIESHTARVKFDEDIESHIVSFKADTGADINRKMRDFEDKQTTNQPSFYLCVDRNMKYIVVSVRGTVPYDVLDVLTDLNAQPMQYSIGEVHGTVHRGMSLSAKHVLDAIRDDEEARELLFTYRDYDVLFCGHSLGAGVAALMAMRVHNGEASVFSEFAKKNKIRAYAFASPPVASRSLLQPDQAWNRDGVVTSVALSTDLVTRLSVRSVKTHDERCEWISNWKPEEIQVAMRSRSEEIHVAMTKGDERGDWLIEGLKDMGESDGQMFPLGKVLWYVPDVRQAGKEKSIHVLDDGPKDKDLRLSGFLNTAWLYFCPLLDGTIGGLAKRVLVVALKPLIAVLNFLGFDLDIELDQSLSASEKYGAARYQLCDATGCKKEIFQNLILDIESLHAHFPNRYLWACGVTLKQEKQE